MSDQINAWEGEAPQQESESIQLATAADQIFNDVMVPTQQSNTQTVLSEAIKRIEQAKLYETLLKHDLFGAGSARVEIVQTVQNEIREFALNRLEVLLGMKAAVAPQPVVRNPFATEEIMALKSLAARMLQREAPARETNPQIVPVMQESSAVPFSQIREQFKLAEASTDPVPVAVQPIAAPTQEAPRRAGRPRKAAAMIPGKGIPMPSNDMMNGINASIAARNEQAMGASPAVAISLKSAAKLPDEK